MERQFHPLCIEFSPSAGFERVCGISRDSMTSLMNGGKLSSDIYDSRAVVSGVSGCVQMGAKQKVACVSHES